MLVQVYANIRVFLIPISIFICMYVSMSVFMFVIISVCLYGTDDKMRSIIIQITKTSMLIALNDILSFVAISFVFLSSFPILFCHPLPSLRFFDVHQSLTAYTQFLVTCSPMLVFPQQKFICRMELLLNIILMFRDHRSFLIST